eukprot:SAG11_NODE_2163_length_3728_cov_19.144944_6_plen_51_part_00
MANFGGQRTGECHRGSVSVPSIVLTQFHNRIDFSILASLQNCIAVPSASA